MTREINFNRDHASAFKKLLTADELKAIKLNGFILKGTETSYDLTPDGKCVSNDNFLVYRVKDKKTLRLQNWNDVRGLAYLGYLTKPKKVWRISE
jgi:hypothetical protein